MDYITRQNGDVQNAAMMTVTREERERNSVSNINIIKIIMNRFDMTRWRSLYITRGVREYVESFNASKKTKAGQIISKPDTLNA